ncbi:MAG: hypothetical protein GQ542_15070 [Desulforhopalus sp.]|nr:hypothetical protein [Desulforhopalus sp.]
MHFVQSVKIILAEMEQFVQTARTVTQKLKMIHAKCTMIRMHHAIELAVD